MSREIAQVRATDPLRAPAEGGVTVRMYGQGLGDCFLLAFGPDDQTRPHYVLIDCGVVLGTPDAVNRMRTVVENIGVAVGPHGIDLLVVTHEHWDHVSGFSQAADLWKTIPIRKIWLAWTENPDDDLGKKLKAEFRNNIRALQATALRAEAPDRRERFNGLVGLYGDPFAARGDAFSEQTHAALDTLLKVAPGPGQVEYLEPGDVRWLGDPSVATVYVLGPPKDETRLKKTNPSRRAPETYPKPGESDGLHLLATPALTEHGAFRLALGWSASEFDPDPAAQDPDSTHAPHPGPTDAHGLTGALSAVSQAAPAGDPVGPRLSPAEELLREQSFPFEPQHRIPWRAAARDPFFVRRYGFETPYPGGPETGETWRRINDDWLGVADALALQMDSYTNNTSLVLAFDLHRSRRVLLFAADAQVGNWLSWHDITRGTNAEGNPVPVSVADLLAGTCVYKVGHHGSHNATVREGGLESMAKGGDLVAFVPVSEPVAHEIKHWDEMPLPSLMDRLHQLCDGRVLRPAPAPCLVPEVPNKRWTEFLARVQVAGSLLPAKQRRRPDGSMEELEPEVPLFVQYGVADVPVPHR